jgi:hypothetical protein
MTQVTPSNAHVRSVRIFCHGTLMTGLAFGEALRWHAGRLWVSDWGAEHLIAVDFAGNREIVLLVPSFPFCID